MEEKTIYRYTLQREKVSDVSDSIYMTDPSRVAEFLRSMGLAQEEQEHLVVLTLNPKNAVTGYYTVTIGLVNQAQAAGREIFRKAIIANATGIIMAHNHPSNSCDPSTDDVRLTSLMRDAGKIVDITLMDHIIVGERDYFSFREKNIL